jgi:hypothetical protein
MRLVAGCGRYDARDGDALELDDTHVLAPYVCPDEPSLDYQRLRLRP